MKTLNLFVLASVLAVTPACKKKEASTSKATQGSGSASVDTTGSAGMTGTGSAADTGSGSAMAGSEGDPGTGSAAAAAGSGTAAATDPAADYIVVHARHAKPKPEDPVELRFEKFKVVKADFDPQKIEGGKATIDVDVLSLKSDSDKRDTHVRSADYLDATKWTTFTINVDKVKKKDGKMYDAEATVKYRGLEKKYPVAFEVVDAQDDWIRVRGEHKFPRMDWKVGKSLDKGEGVAEDLTVRLQLTLKKT